MRTTTLLATLLITTACAAPPSPPKSSAPPAATTTGLLPPDAPTEGTRPPADALPPPAEPERAPAPRQPPPGRVVLVGQAPEGVVVDATTRTVAVAVRNPDQLVLLNADTDTGTVTARTPLPGAVRHLQLARPGGPVLVPVESANSLVQVDLPSGQAHPSLVTGTVPHDATETVGGEVFVANEHGGTVTVVRDDRIVKVFTDSVQPAGLAVIDSSVGLIDVRKNDLTVYDADTLHIIGSTPAGQGPTHLLADKHGRFIAADTRGDTVRVFQPLPTPREVASIAQPGGPYGITYDPTRDRLWVASSGTNEVLGYDMGRPEPRLVQRIPTVQNPYTLGADSTTGRLFIAGVTAGVLQIVDPSA